MSDDARVHQRVGVRLAPHGLHRQVAQSVGFGDLALFEVSPPQVAQIECQKRTVLNGQAPAETERLVGERLGFVELLLLNINPRQDDDGVDGEGMFLAEDAAAQFKAAERQ